MDKNYDHKKFEDQIYKMWEDSGAFEPTGKGEQFSILMPPPNANDPLHVGHAMFVAIEDILIRYHRMKGDSTLWLPGTDHAGIETQFVFEKKLAKIGKSRFDFDRDTLYKMIWDYVQENSTVAVDQMKKLGASADWSKYKFTLDPDIVDQVIETFIKLNVDGLVYRSVRLVNYCTKCGTGYSELEVDYQEKEDKLYFINYGPLEVATTRPETIFGDVAVAVNPNDKRYLKLIGEEISLPLTSRKIKIISDKEVDIKFGTGAVKITPSCDSFDWDICDRQGWDTAQLAQDFPVKNRNEKAREKTILDLGNLVTKVESFTHNVGACYRCQRVIEKIPLKQLFIKVRPLAEKALKALDNKETVIFGAGREKILRHWLENLKDWNISRQITWGIRIPVWYKDGEMKVSRECPGEGWIQDNDTFDTWFSSGQWPIVALPKEFYPSSVMETGYDILPFWVMRMMMLGIYMTGKSPFKQVYLHGLIRDEQGRKMSKSIGNVINPLDMVNKYGADALRMALVMSSTPGQDKAVGESAIRGMRNFSNKIWNAARFVQSMADTQEGDKDQELVENLNESIRIMSERLEKLEIGWAAEWIYSWFWHAFCDRYIEIAKSGHISKKVMIMALETNLKLLHPFMPFVTEVIWQELGHKDLLITNTWPKY